MANLKPCSSRNRNTNDIYTTTSHQAPHLITRSGRRVNFPDFFSVS
ncbi:hypothetical protein B4U80_08802 [Leptotrombidium deliense]|uniref:Uncharacterized protein n=1 Tax=Leptotrombidium deliense TaxID=299467 RepID=A0A443S2B0_9ACAR|nr:hypothetical protein B4U80_08802 [Leptotrombidium deliense]